MAGLPLQTIPLRHHDSAWLSVSIAEISGALAPPIIAIHGTRSNESGQGAPTHDHPPTGKGEDVSRALSKIRATALPRRGLSREEAAMYLGIGATAFDDMRARGQIDAPRLIGGRKLWDIRDLDMAFDALPREDVPKIGQPWDDA